MQIAAIGVGGAGSRIVNALHEDDTSRAVTYLAGAQAIDTGHGTLAELSSLPEESRQVVNYQRAQSTADKAGEQADVSATEEGNIIEIRRTADSVVNSDVAAIVLVAGLGGETGSVIAPQLAKALRGVYEIPIYSVSVLPALREDTTISPAKPLQALHGVVETQFVFDNEGWLGSDEELSDVVSELNQSLAERLGVLFSAGEAADSDTVGQRVVDASEIIATLDAGGLATIGYARQAIGTDSQSSAIPLVDTVRGLFSSSTEVDEVSAIKAVETTLRRAVRGRLTLDCPLDTAASGLLVVSGPPEWLHQSAISDGQRWLANEIGSVQLRTGDHPEPDGDSVRILTLFAGIHDASRIDELATSGTE